MWKHWGEYLEGTCRILVFSLWFCSLALWGGTLLFQKPKSDLCVNLRQDLPSHEPKETFPVLKLMLTKPAHECMRVRKHVSSAGQTHEPAEENLKVRRGRTDSFQKSLESQLIASGRQSSVTVLSLVPCGVCLGLPCDLGRSGEGDAYNCKWK